MTTAQVGPSEPDWDDGGLDLDAIGLAAEFAAYVRGRGIVPEDQPRALAAWLDEMIAGLDTETKTEAEAGTPAQD